MEKSSESYSLKYIMKVQMEVEVYLFFRIQVLGDEVLGEIKGRSEK